MEKSFEYHREDDTIGIMSDSEYELISENSDLIRLLLDARKRGFKEEDILGTHRLDNKGHIKLEIENKLGYGRIIKEGEMYRLYIPVTTVSEEST